MALSLPRVRNLMVGEMAAQLRLPTSIQWSNTTRLLNPADVGFPMKGQAGFTADVDVLRWAYGEWNASKERRDALKERLRAQILKTIAEMRAGGKTSACIDLEMFIPSGTFDWLGLLSKGYAPVPLQRVQSGVCVLVQRLFAQHAPDINAGLFNLPMTEPMVVMSSEPFTGGSHRARRAAWFETMTVDAGSAIAASQTMYPCVYLPAPMESLEDVRQFVRDVVHMTRLVSTTLRTVAPVLGTTYGEQGDNLPPDVVFAMLDECRACGCTASLWAYAPKYTSGMPYDRTAKLQRFLDSLATAPLTTPLK